MMKLSFFKIAFLFSAVLFCNVVKSETFLVSSQQEFDDAQDDAAMNDTIMWETGTFHDIDMEISKSYLSVIAENLGQTIFSGASMVEITGDNILFMGFQFLDGQIGTKDVINIRGSHIVFTQVNIRAYTCYKYLRIRESSQYVDVTYCNFENRLNEADQNILSILVDDQMPGYHRVRYCSFKNFPGNGNDEGVEPIRIGLSTQADRISRSLVEYCYFTKCDGDGELISSKASQNVYRYNTFENNPKAELVLRHGSEAIVYGNFFLNGKGGVRVREGQNHYIYNNYFFELDDRAIYLQNEDSDPLDQIHIAFNTIVDCSEVILGGDGPDEPTNVVFSNNIFTQPDDDLFEDATGNETWISNIAHGNLGIPFPSNGISTLDPVLAANDDGFFGLSPVSPAIDAAESGYVLLPQFEGIDDIDSDIRFDLMGQSRPEIIEDRDLGCHEFPHQIMIRPIATEDNTGPSYNTSTVNHVRDDVVVVHDLIRVSPNPSSNTTMITIMRDHPTDLTIDVFDVDGRMVSTFARDNALPGGRIRLYQLDSIPAGIYTIRALSRSMNSTIPQMQSVRYVKQ